MFDCLFLAMNTIDAVIERGFYEKINTLRFALLEKKKIAKMCESVRANYRIIMNGSNKGVTN